MHANDHGITTLDMSELDAEERLLLSNDLFWMEENEGLSRAAAERELWRRITAGGNPEVDPETGVGVLKRYVQSLRRTEREKQREIDGAHAARYFEARHETKVRRGRGSGEEKVVVFSVPQGSVMISPNSNVRITGEGGQ